MTNLESESEVAQSCPTLCDPMDCSPPGSSVHGIFQARVLEWIAISFSSGSSQPRDWTRVSRTVGRCFTIWATKEAPLSRDITLSTKVRLVKAVVFPVVMYGCESWTVKKAEHRRIDAFELWCWRRLLRVLCLLLLLPSVFPSSKVFSNEVFRVLSNELFTSSGQCTGASASSSVLPMNIQGWFSLELTVDLLAVQGILKSLLQHQFSLLCGPALTTVHDYWKKP